MIDGASHTRMFFQIMLPMAKPGLISVDIFNFLGQWNQYLLPIVLLHRRPDKRVLTQGIAASRTSRLRGRLVRPVRRPDHGDPPGADRLHLFQRQIQSGLTAGAVK